MKTIEYKVRPVTRFVVTRFERNGMMAASTSCGEFDRVDDARRVAFAAARMDQEEYRCEHNCAEVIFPDLPPDWKYFPDA